MNRNFNYWSSKGNGSNSKKENKKVESPKVKYSICTKDSLVGVYCDNEDYIVDTDYADDISIGCLEALYDLVADISTNDTLEDEISIIYVPDVIGALVTGGIADYVRIKKTKTGEEVSDEKLQLYKDIDEMVKDRSYNVILRSYAFQDKTFQAKAVAWIKEEVRNATAKANGKERTTTSTTKVTNTNNSAIDKLNAQIVELTMAGKFQEAQQVAQILATMTGKKDELEVKDEETGEQASC